MLFRKRVCPAPVILSCPVAWLRPAAAALLALGSFALAQVNPPQVSVTSPLRTEYALAPGESRPGSITIRNPGTESATVEVDQVDFTLDTNGQISYVTADGDARSNREWIEVASQVTVPAGASVNLPFTVRVPDDPGLQGTYWSMIVVEPSTATTLQDEEDDERDVRTSVTVNLRYGVVVLVDVGTPASPEVLFTEPRFAGAAGDYALSLTLGNPGDFLVAADVWLELYDEAGELVRRADRGEVRLYPRATLAQRFELGALEPGTYQAVVMADVGGNELHGVRYTLEAEREAGHGE